MNEQFTWGQQGAVQKQPVVAMTGNDAQNLVTAVVAGVTKAVVERQAVDALEAYKQTVTLGAEVTRLRDQLAQRDNDIASLHQHIARLNQVLSSIQAQPVQPQYNNPSYGMLQPTQSYVAPIEVPAYVPVPAYTPNGTEG